MSFSNPIYDDYSRGFFLVLFELRFKTYGRPRVISAKEGGSLEGCVHCFFKKALFFQGLVAERALFFKDGGITERLLFWQALFSQRALFWLRSVELGGGYFSRGRYQKGW